MSEDQSTGAEPTSPAEKASSAKNKVLLIVAGLAVALIVGVIAAVASMNSSVSSAQALENYKANMQPFEDRTTELVNEVNSLRDQGVGDGSFASVVAAVAEEWNSLALEVELVETPTPDIVEAHGFFTKYMSEMGKAYDYFAIGLETSDVEMIYLGNDFQEDASGSILQYAASISLLESKESQKTE